MCFIPLSEWGTVNLDDGILNQSFCTDQLVAAGIINYIDDSGFACATWKETMFFFIIWTFYAENLRIHDIEGAY